MYTNMLKKSQSERRAKSRGGSLKRKKEKEKENTLVQNVRDVRVKNKLLICESFLSWQTVKNSGKTFLPLFLQL